MIDYNDSSKRIRVDSMWDRRVIGLMVASDR